MKTMLGDINTKQKATRSCEERQQRVIAEYNRCRRKQQATTLVAKLPRCNLHKQVFLLTSWNPEDTNEVLVEE